MHISIFVHLDSQWASVSVSQTGCRHFCIIRSFLSFTRSNKKFNKFENIMWACPFNGPERKHSSDSWIGCSLQLLSKLTESKMNEIFSSPLHWRTELAVIGYVCCVGLFQLSPSRSELKPDNRFLTARFIYLTSSITAWHPAVPVPDIDIRILDFRTSPNSPTSYSFWMCYKIFPITYN